MLYSHNSANLILGAICNDCTLALNNKFPLTKEDFRPNQFQMIIFVTLYNLALKGVKEASEIEVYEFLKNYKEQFNIFNDNDGSDYINTIKTLSNIDNYEYYWNNLKKYSLLRVYKNKGFDISKFFDETKDELKECKKLDLVELDDIINYYDGIQSNIKKNFYINGNIEETKMGEGFEEIKEQFKEKPLYGASFLSEYLNTATRGWIESQYAIFSSPTSVGKTTIGIASLCNVCATKLWNYKTKQFEVNKNCRHKAGLYLQFELDNKIECTPKFLSYISGVNSAIITKGQYKDDEEYRVDEAIKILQESNIYTVSFLDFTMKEIDAVIGDYVLNKSVSYVVFDYLQGGGSINQEIAKRNGTTTNEQQVLTMLSAFLKDEAKKYGIAIRTMTQCNDRVATQDILDESCIMGSRGVAFKGDIGTIILPPRPKEVKAYDEVKQKGGFHHLECTHVIHLYKSRFGAEAKNIRIFVNVDMGTGRMTDLFVFDKNIQPYKLDKTILNNI